MKEPFAAFVERELDDAPVVIACGLPATNKTETMDVVVRLKGYTMLRSDLIRLEVHKNEDIFDDKVASNMSKRTQVYDEMFRLADEAAARGEGVILDATFVTQALRRRAAEVAARHGRRLVIQETRCSEAYSLAKIAKRSRSSYESNALTPDAYYNNVKKLEPVDLDDLKSRYPTLDLLHLVVDTDSDREEDWHVVAKSTR